MLLVQKFIALHPTNWKELLQEKYHIITKTKTIKDKTYYLLKYDFVGADWHNPMVRECRGLILDSKFKAKSLPFYKFGNYGEAYNEPLDLESMQILEKIDGSLISLWWNGDEWTISTSGNIDARDSLINNEGKTYYDVFNEVLKVDLIRLSGLLDIDCCYVFELVSPEIQVVVPYPEPMLYHLTSRDMTNLQEFEIDLGITKPKVYEFKTLEDCIRVSKELAWNDEGYVAVDKNYNRAKIKSPAWVAAHVSGETIKLAQRDCRLLDIVIGGELEEYLVYFPSYKEKLEEVEKCINYGFSQVKAVSNKINYINKLREPLIDQVYLTQKEMAKIVMEECKHSAAYIFEQLKHEDYNERINLQSYIQWISTKSKDFKDKYISILRKELTK